MFRYPRTGTVVAAFLASSIAAQAADLSMTPIYRGRPSAVSATDWALADRWMIYRSAEASVPLPAQADSNSSQSNSWSTGSGYILLTRWSLKGEYVYVNFLDPSASDAPPGTSTVAK